MPVYVYKNLKTGETFEVEQRITESALTEHPESGDPVKRLIQPVGIAFKGSGFYATDSRSSGSGAKTGGSDAAKPEGGSASGDGATASKGGSTASDAGSGSGASSGGGSGSGDA